MRFLGSELELGMNVKYLEAVADPGRFYDSPASVLLDESLSPEEKREVLLSWEAESIHRCEEPSRVAWKATRGDSGLAKVRLALEALSR